MARRPLPSSSQVLNPRSVAECYLTAGHCLLKMSTIAAHLQGADGVHPDDLRRLAAAVKTLSRDLDNVAKTQQARVMKMIEKDRSLIEQKEEEKEAELAKKNLSTLQTLLASINNDEVTIEDERNEVELIQHPQMLEMKTTEDDGNMPHFPFFGIDHNSWAMQPDASGFFESPAFHVECGPSEHEAEKEKPEVENDKERYISDFEMFVRDVAKQDL
ncbi:hypothetical protein QR680_006844 [Steinernema hermaphroditum]|uniref:Uncharacterized protein n=1 Tax=Steinernema hermaphroditum TaxID=289476 RepID=A0AA39HYW9_9BILA|nr:hypothetical protein QR680_006844 [Steinernema hermaphroditum]